MSTMRTSGPELSAMAEALRRTHVRGRPLVLPNVWDAATARTVADAGYSAIATSSGAMAQTLGYADHEQTPPAEMFAAIARIARAVDLPVTADIESGYGLAADDLVERLLSAGAVGCNLEDTDHTGGGRVSPLAQAERLSAVRAAAGAAGIPVVLNARIDAWVHPGSDGERLADAVDRGRRCLDAGADCVYPILLSDPATIGRLVDALDGPVNIMYRDGGPSLDELAALGVARVSYGTSLFRRQQASWQELVSGLAGGATHPE